MLGSAFTRETALQIVQQLPLMVVTTVLTIAVALWCGVLTARHARTDMMSGLFGSVPGGLSQMLVISEEIEGIEATVVVLMQTIRVLAVVFFVPFLAIHGIGDGTADSLPPSSPNPHTDGLLWYQYILYAAIPFLGAWIGKRIHLPNSILAGPLLAIAVVVVIGKQEAPPLPVPLILLSQLAIGINIGLQVKPDMLKNAKLSAYSIGGSLVLLLFSLLLAFGLTMITPMTLTTAFLSTAPGGIAEMGVTAKMVHADLSMVSGYHLFRIFFIMFFVPPLLQWWVRKREKKHSF